MSQTTSPLHGMPVLDLPFPRQVPDVAPRSAPHEPRRPARALPSAQKTMLGVAPMDDVDPANRPAMALPSAQKTMLGVAPMDDVDPANRPTVPDAPVGRPRPQRTIVGVGPAMLAAFPAPRARVDDAEDAPEIVTEPADVEVAALEVAWCEAVSFEAVSFEVASRDALAAAPREVAVAAEAASREALADQSFQPSAFARDPGLGAVESIRLPRRRIEAGDWLLLAVIVALVAGVIVALV